VDDVDDNGLDCVFFFFFFFMLEETFYPLMFLLFNRLSFLLIEFGIYMCVP
jgi:hypothetical protein